MNERGAAMLGDMADFSGRDRNLARQFNGARSRFRRAPGQTERLEAELVADLHAAAAPDPPDAEKLARLAELVLAGVPG